MRMPYLNILNISLVPFIFNSTYDRKFHLLREPSDKNYTNIHIRRKNLTKE